jgi:hypothetical protein
MAVPPSLGTDLSLGADATTVFPRDRHWNDRETYRGGFLGSLVR